MEELRLQRRVEILREAPRVEELRLQGQARNIATWRELGLRAQRAVQMESRQQEQRARERVLRAAAVLRAAVAAAAMLVLIFSDSGIRWTRSVVSLQRATAPEQEEEQGEEQEEGRQQQQQELGQKQLRRAPTLQ